MPDKILIIGMSHIVALNGALRPKERETVTVLHLNDNSGGLYDPKTNTLDLSVLEIDPPDRVYVSIGGNFHNVFSVFENPMPFSFGDATTGAVSFDPTRRFIPYDMIYEHFERCLEPALKHMEPIHDRFRDSSIYCLCAPPPIADEDHIRRYPGLFAPKIEQGFAPRNLRLRAHRLQRDIYNARCTRLGGTFIDPPEAALDAEGFLGKAYWNNDPTHGNAAYGRLVLDQSLATMRADA